MSYWAQHKALSDANSLIVVYIYIHTYIERERENDCRNLMDGLFWHKIYALTVRPVVLLPCNALHSAFSAFPVGQKRRGVSFKHSDIPGNDCMNIKCSMLGSLLFS